MMRWLIVFIGFFLMGPGNSALARDDTNNNRFQSFVSVIGPVSVSSDQNLKLCLTDISLVTQSGSSNKGQRWSKRYNNGRSNNAPVVSSSTRIEVFDSTDTTRPLPLDIDDMIFRSGKGACINVPGYEMTVAGYDMTADALSRSVVIVLTTLTEARAVFDPAASGQLTTPDNTSAVGMLLPAVQSVREGRSGGSAGTCCACAPVCGCGTCD